MCGVPHLEWIGWVVSSFYFVCIYFKLLKNYSLFALFPLLPIKGCPQTGTRRQVGLCEFEAILVYTGEEGVQEGCEIGVLSRKRTHLTLFFRTAELRYVCWLIELTAGWTKAMLRETVNSG